MKICPPHLWLSVDGAPRSGTTALLNVLNRSKDIFIFHEFPEADLQHAFEPIHAMAARLRQTPNKKELAAHLLEDESANAMLLAFLAYSASGKIPRIVGTKDPDSVLHPFAPLMKQAARKTIHITRNPLSIIPSALKWVDTERGNNSEITLDNRAMLLRVAALTIRNWNNACQNATAMNFLHVFYEDLGAEPERIGQDINDFLGTDDVSLAGWAPPKPAQNGKPRLTAEQFLADCEALLGPDAAFIVHSGLIFDWGERHERLRRRQMMAPPILIDTPVSFTGEGFGWPYILHGLTSATEQGTWIENRLAALLFSLPPEVVAPEFEVVFSRIQAPMSGVSIVLTMTLNCGSDLDSATQSAEFTFAPGRPAPRVALRAKPVAMAGGGYAPVWLRLRFRAVDAGGNELPMPERYNWAMVNALIVHRT